MLKKGKWAKPSQASEPVSRVAEGVIRERLELVCNFAPKAAKKWHNVEHLHQLRVATRRNAATLVTFSELLPDKRTQKVQKHLKRLRKASGVARDLDVLTAVLRQELHAGSDELVPVIEWLDNRRSDAQRLVVAAVAHLKEKDFTKKINSLCRRIRWRGAGGEPTYSEAAPRLLAAAGREFHTAAEKDLSDARAMHELRIVAKRLRYTVEVLAGAFDRSFRRELYPLLRELQDKLGQVNDAAVARQRFEQWSIEAPAELAGRFVQFASQYEEQFCERRRDFLQW